MWKVFIPFIPFLFVAPALAADPAMTQPEAAVVAAASEVFNGLQDRLENGEPMTPSFIELICSASRRLADAEAVAAQTHAQHRAAAERHLARMKGFLKPILFIRDGRIAIQPQGSQVRYYVATAELWIAALDAEAAKSSNRQTPATQPAVFAADVASKAREAYEALIVLADVGDRVDPVHIDLLYQYSRRWAEAQRDAVATDKERTAVQEAHLARMTALREMLKRHPDEVTRVQKSQADFYVAEAQLWISKAAH